jgi:DNA-directed RNA polymerase subunit M/transcription elongation factor TFIIS
MNKELLIENFSYEKEYLKNCDFIMENSLYLDVKFIQLCESQINRKQTVETIDKLINCINISDDIEKGIFEFSLNYVKAQSLPNHFFQLTYNDKLNDLLLNLDVNNKRIENKTLQPDLLNGKFSGQIIAFLNMYQLHPMRWKSIIDKNNLKDDTMANVNTTDEYKCGRCGERKHIYYITQTRCIDEPATIFYTCTVCRKTFTKSM